MSLSYSTASLATADGGDMNVCNCRVCGHRGSDIQMVGCGCTIHAVSNNSGAIFETEGLRKLSTTTRKFGHGHRLDR